MPHFRVFIDGSDTGTTVTAANVEDAYFDFASTTSLTYKDTLRAKRNHITSIGKTNPEATDAIHKG